jgi:hypothetical protein
MKIHLLIVCFVYILVFGSGSAWAGSDGLYVYVQSVRVEAVERAPLIVQLVGPRCLASEPEWTQGLSYRDKGVAVVQPGTCTEAALSNLSLCSLDTPKFSSIKKGFKNGQFSEEQYNAYIKKYGGEGHCVAPAAVELVDNVADLRFDAAVLAKVFGLSREKINAGSVPQLTFKSLLVDAIKKKTEKTLFPRIPTISQRHKAKLLLALESGKIQSPKQCQAHIHHEHLFLRYRIMAHLGPAPTLDVLTGILKLDVDKVIKQLGPSPTIDELVNLVLDKDLDTQPDIRTDNDGQQWAVYETAIGKDGLTIRNPSNGAATAICMNAPLSDGYPVLTMNGEGSIDNHRSTFQMGLKLSYTQKPDIKRPVFVSVGEPKTITSSCLAEPLPPIIGWYSWKTIFPEGADAKFTGDVPATVGVKWKAWDGDVDKLFTHSNQGGILFQGTGSRQCLEMDTRWPRWHKVDWIKGRIDNMDPNQPYSASFSKGKFTICEVEPDIDVRSVVFKWGKEHFPLSWGKEEKRRFKELKKIVKQSSTVEIDWTGVDGFMCDLQRPFLETMKELSTANSVAWGTSSKHVNNLIKSINFGITNAESSFTPPPKIVGENMVCRTTMFSERGTTFELSDERQLGVNFVPVTIAHRFLGEGELTVQEYTDSPVTQRHLYILYGM